MSYVRGAVHTEEGELIASFAQDALIRPLRTTDTSIKRGVAALTGLRRCCRGRCPAFCPNKRNKRVAQIFR